MLPLAAVRKSSFRNFGWEEACYDKPVMLNEGLF